MTAPAATRAPRTEAVRVLLVEDDPGDAALVRALLSPGHEVADAATVAEAVAALADPDVTYDCVLLDLGLPDAEGLDGLRAALEAAGGCPVVVLTGADGEEQAAEAVHLGAQDYLDKNDLDERVLRRSIRYARERTGSRRALAEREAHYRQVMDSLVVGLVEQRVDGPIVGANPSAARILGLTRDQVLGRTSVDPRWRAVHEDGSPFPGEEHPAMVALRERRVVEGVLMGVHRPDGELAWIEIDATPLHHPGATEPYAVVTCFRDVTDAREAAAAVRFQASLLDAVGQAVMATDVNGSITYWNRAAEQLYGWPAAEVLGRSAFDFMPADVSPKEAEAIIAALRRGEGFSGDFTMRRRDGTTFPALVNDTPVFDAGGNVVGIIGVSVDITERLRSRREIEEARRRLEDAQAVAQLGSWELDPRTGDVSWSAQLYRILDIDPTTPSSVDLYMAHVPSEDRPGVQALLDRASREGTATQSAHRFVRDSGETRWVHARAVGELAPDGTVRRVVGTLLDITDRRRAELEREDAETLFRIGFERSAAGMAIADLDGRPTMVNPAVCDLLDRDASELLGRRWTAFGHPDDGALGEAVVASVAGGVDSHQDERRYLRPDGTVVWALASITLVRDDDGTPLYYFGHFQDITDRKRMEDELAHQALHDSLTGLPNRALLSDRLTMLLAGAGRRGSTVCVVLLDLDRFKLVNDSMGHAAGDELLCAVADRLRATLRPGDTVARFGGDEFVVVSESVGPPRCGALGERISRAFEEPFLVEGRELFVSASLGIATAGEGASAGGVLRDADAAMYLAKERGRGRAEQFDETLRRRATTRLETETALRRALERGELRVHYQPLVRLDGVPVGLEALVRWWHPTEGFVHPEQFIPLAEETGLIVPIGAWVLDEALGMVRDLRRSVPGASDLYVSVNLSARQLAEADLVEQVWHALAAGGTSAGALYLEITETVLMADVERSVDVLARLKALGVRLAVDDFGTGYSSLSYLKRFPIDRLKIDRSFVDGVDGDAHDSSIVKAVMSLARALDLDVLAEGVETHGQRAALAALGCGLAQGYLWSPPIPPDRVAHWLAQRLRPAPGFTCPLSVGEKATA